MFSILITKDCPISNGKEYLLSIPQNVLSENEQKVWMKVACALYDSSFNLNNTTNNDLLSNVGLLVYACKFAVTGRGRFKDYCKENKN